MPTNKTPQQGLSLLELLLAISISAILFSALFGLVNNALNIEQHITAKNRSLQQARFAMQMMIKSVRMSTTLLVPLSENTNTSYSESVRNVLAITLDPTMDRDKDGWADANNDQDYLDLNNNGSRDAGEPERIDEDPGADITNDGQSGIIGIDDNGDGSIDNGRDKNDDDEDGVREEDPVNGLDDDNDGSIDEDYQADKENDNAAGVLGKDDDLDGSVDEGQAGDDDEDGSLDEDWLDAVVYFVNGTTLMQRLPNINPSSGSDYQEYPIADKISSFQVKRIPAATATLVKISLSINADDGETIQLSTQVRLGSGLYNQSP